MWYIHTLTTYRFSLNLSLFRSLSPYRDIVYWLVGCVVQIVYCAVCCSILLLLFLTSNILFSCVSLPLFLLLLYFFEFIFFFQFLRLIRLCKLYLCMFRIVFKKQHDDDDEKYEYIYYTRLYLLLFDVDLIYLYFI